MSKDENPFRSVKCQGDVFLAQEMAEALLAHDCNLPVRVHLPDEPKSRPIKGFNVGNCGDFVALYLHYGAVGEARD